MSDPLKILLVDSYPERAAMLEQHIRETGDGVILRAPPGGNLLDIAAAAAPDVIIVVMAQPERDALANLQRLSAKAPRPIVLFIERDDRSFMEEAIAAGVCSYNAIDAAFPNVEPAAMAAVAIFRRHRQLILDLQRATATLAEREMINRAKKLLMKERNMDEPRAYRWLRRRAMKESKPIAATAADLLARKEGGTQRQ